MDDTLIPTEQPADAAPAHRRVRRDGWTADRQRIFLTALAETGCVSAAAEEAGVSARSAYRLRAHPAGRRFASCWDQALGVATGRLATVAFERALRGEFRETWRDGRIVGETRTPSDKLLMFLLRQLDRRRFGPSTAEDAVGDDFRDLAAAALPRELAALRDVDAVEATPLGAEDYDAVQPTGAERTGSPMVRP